MSGPVPRPHSGPQRSFAALTGVTLDQQLVRFVIPEMSHDLEKGICLTIALARNHPDAHVRSMYGRACRFFRRVDALFLAAQRGDTAAFRKLTAMLRFPEVAEIRLGYTLSGHDGSGIGGGDLSRHLIDYLGRYRQLRETLKVEPDAIQMVPFIGMDRASDAMATICKVDLIDFTKWCAHFYHFDPACMRQATVRNVWDETSKTFVKVADALPVDDNGRVLLLVPKGIARSGTSLGAAGYFDNGGPKGSPVPTRPAQRDKEAALRDSEAHPGKLQGYTFERMKHVTPRREFLPPKRRK
jgi:hypothetical protein